MVFKESVIDRATFCEVQENEELPTKAIICWFSVLIGLLVHIFIFLIIYVCSHN